MRPYAARLLGSLNSKSVTQCILKMRGSVFCCRVHAQALLVLDDEDFHERQDMLSLGQHRAIATALNSLVFHTHCPAAQTAQTGSRAPIQGPLPALQGVHALHTYVSTHAVHLKSRYTLMYCMHIDPHPQALQGQCIFWEELRGCSEALFSAVSMLLYCREA